MPDFPKLPPVADQPLSLVLLARPGDDVPAALAAWRAWLDERRPAAHEIIVVGEAVPEQAEHPVRAIKLAEKSGEGVALREGLRATTMPLVCYAPCDPAYSPAMLGLLLDRAVELEEGGTGKEIDHVHLLSGFRAGEPVPALSKALGGLWWALSMVLFAYPTRPLPGWLGMRRRLGGLLARVLFGLRNRDVACPFRLMRRDVLERIPIQSDGPFAHVELLAKANFLGFMMGDEVPLDVRPPIYKGDAKGFFRDGRRVFNKPDFGPAVLPKAQEV